MHAYADSTPELFHNEVECWEEESGNFVPVLVRHQQEPKRENERLRIFIEMLRQSSNPTEVWGDGRSKLGQLVSLNYQLDFASYYTAILRGVDPYSVRTINRLKSG